MTSPFKGCVRPLATVNCFEQAAAGARAERVLGACGHVLSPPRARLISQRETTNLQIYFFFLEKTIKFISFIKLIY